jgi:hypothetical protein
VGKTMDNIALIQAQGDRVAAFYYDRLIDSGTPGWDGLPPLYAPHQPNTEDWSSRLLIGEGGAPSGFLYWDNVNDSTIYTLDPADPFVISFWRWRDALVTAETDPPLDALYFDLGFAVSVYGSYPALAQAAPTHPSGAGRWLIAAMREALDYPRGAPNPRGFRYGAENATEPFADLVDFYHLGAGGDGPLRGKLAGSDPPAFTGPDKWIMDGSAFEIPLMAHLQHHLGNLRTGGKMQISYDIGDVFYWIVASEYLWGGVVELIYFNTPMEWLPSLTPELACRGHFERCGFQTDWGNTQVNGDRRGWSVNDNVREADPDKLAYLRSAIELRVASDAAPYLTLGRMEAAPTLSPEPASVEFSYSYYASINGPEHHHSGVWSAPPVRVAAWRHPDDGTVALMVANAASETIVTSMVVDPSLYGMDDARLVETDLALNQSGRSSPANVWRAGERYVIPLTLPAHAFRMFVLTP